MDTSQVAELIGTTPRLLRVFLRSSYSTFVPVGSGARYDFTDKELPTLAKRFADWQGAGKPRPDGDVAPRAVTPKPKKTDQEELDRAVWVEEGRVALADIRDPRVRARVKADAQAAEARLTTLLISKGVHVAQGWAASPASRKGK